MSKVLRIHNKGNNNIVGWQAVSSIGSGEINNIEDPDGATCRKEITSIPSPFARMDLVKTAFAEVAKSGELDGDTIYHSILCMMKSISSASIYLFSLAQVPVSVLDLSLLLIGPLSLKMGASLPFEYLHLTSSALSDLNNSPESIAGKAHK